MLFRPCKDDMPLNPNHPIQSTRVPTVLKMGPVHHQQGDCAHMRVHVFTQYTDVCVDAYIYLPYIGVLSVPVIKAFLGPTAMAPMKAAQPPTRCTTPDPAKSKTPQPNLRQS